MLVEYLRKVKPPLAAWSGAMPGVLVCRFSLEGVEDSAALAPELEPGHFETLFCRGGRLILERSRGRLQTVEAREVLLLSDSASLRGGRADGPFSGMLVAVDAVAARASLASLCRLTGLALDTTQVRRRMAQQEGCAVVPGGPWSDAAFENLDRLPSAEQERYGAFKTLELLYLLCTGGALLKGEGHACSGGYLGRTAAEVRLYMESHLEDKLTIAGLSRRFCVSQTALKSSFQRTYGTSIHRWLHDQRMRRAGELLRGSSMNVQQVARAVGYEGVSQFHVAFRQHYGMTPGQYAKMSKAGGI